MLPNQAMNINHPTLRFEKFYVLNSNLNFVYQRDQPCRYIFSLSNIYIYIKAMLKLTLPFYPHQ
jgi:hypothetical protein